MFVLILATRHLHPLNVLLSLSYEFIIEMQCVLLSWQQLKVCVHSVSSHFNMNSLFSNLCKAAKRTPETKLGRLDNTVCILYGNTTILWQFQKKGMWINGNNKPVISSAVAFCYKTYKTNAEISALSCSNKLLE